MFPEKLFQKLKELTSNHKFLVAFSGGMDSHVLLHTLVKIREKNPNLVLRAAYINHGLSTYADLWEKHCRKICRELKIAFISKVINPNLHRKHSLEAIARELRYKALAEILKKNECLLTAHHADDQAETMLMQLFRGGGPKGLASMPHAKGFAHGNLLRPLLTFSRSELHEYALHHELKWVEDESNENTGIDRNFVRHKLIPIIQKRWPSVVKTINRSASHCAAAHELLYQVADQDYSIVKGTIPNSISISKILELSDVRQNNVIRYWLQKLGFPTPSQIKIQHIKSDILHCRKDASPIVKWKGAEVRRYRNNIYAMLPITKIIITETLKWDLAKPLILPKELGTLTTDNLTKLKINLKDLTGNIEIKFRPGIKDAKISHRLKNLFQQNGIPTWIRDTAPLLFHNDELIGIIS